ncbi:type II toxin-antitoxin system RelE/ParE family toxin [Schleiferilactobacillus shenzhenensis]|uniref:Type II toxin-antitoxin system RelE/ParE family toxin n=1 Tax=Schleiferilactobacillus shenzhenensis LY-73 TaxID=1231336 RepID=U4TLF8_9LACO|nr:type II toxin-antitoxin system RelE/ParE family toxin [Schleiferilactobacillus shenzhenensis]ERL64230.1 hypothetical protein L248_1508 [Schleiferilactobacillus shenzhenensis LY-73]
MEKPEFEIFIRPNGHAEFLDFLGTLSQDDQDMVNGLIKAVEDVGMLHAIRKQWVKKLARNLYELRMSTDDTIQRVIYFHVAGPRYIITHGFTKKQEKTPRRQI